MVIQVESAMKTHRRQHGAVLIIFVIGLVLVALSVLLYQLNAGTLKLDRNQKTALALAEAKAALIGEAISSAQLINLAPARLLGSLLNPNLNSVFSLEGSETGTAGSIDRIVVGKFPWYSLNVSIIKDGGDECLWYAVSGRYKHQPATGTLNWDTQGQIDVIDGNGNQIASNLVALIVSSGSSVSGQNRAVVANTYCGGNYDVKNYLDTPNGSNAVAGEVNYFTGSPNNREASNTNNKKFVMTNNDYYNDQFVFITTDDIFNPIIKRQDFANQISLLLDDPDVQTMAQTQPISGTKGTDYLNCALISDSTNNVFCSHWHEMLLLATTASSPTVIDGVSTSCNRVIIFGGKKVDGIQSRLTATEKNNPDNYLEGVNRQAFGDPVNFGFNGVTNFNSNNPSADVMRCL
jgi:hypothetical protein